MRGSVKLINLSKNAYIRSPRSVTMTPTGIPARILKPAIAFLARVTTGFCPVILAISAIEDSRALALVAASPETAIDRYLDRLGDLMDVGITKLLHQFGNDLLLVLSLELLGHDN